MSFEIRLRMLWMYIVVFFEYLLPILIKREMNIKEFTRFVKKLLTFMSALSHNKVAKFKNGLKLDLYLPTAPSKAFYTACDKFRVANVKPPCVSMLISITSACVFRCEHCYQRFDKGKDVNLDLLIKTVRKLQDMGIAYFSMEGGEPFVKFDRLKAVCDAIDDRSEIWINSTGYGMTLEKLKSLNVTAIMFSLHSAEKNKFNTFFNSNDAWEHMLNGVSLCHKVHIPIAFNCCLTKEGFYNGEFEKILEFAKNNKACLVQFIKPKASGAWIGNESLEFSEDDTKIVEHKVNLYNHNKEYIDYPPISSQMMEESPNVFGCTAGGTDRFYINAKGDVQPCEFLNISFGNINEESFEKIYERMRKCFKTPRNCIICEKYARDINKIFCDNNLTTLPIPPKLSKQLFDNWDRGEETKLYKKIKKLDG